MAHLVKTFGRIDRAAQKNFSLRCFAPNHGTFVVFAARSAIGVMGVKGLHTYLENKLPSEQHMFTLAELADQAFHNKRQCTIVVDGMALIRKLYTPDLEWVCGGQYQELWAHVQSFVKAFEAHGLKLVVFLDGGVDEAKLAEWKERRQKDLQKCERVVSSLREGKEPPNAAWMPPPNISKAVGGAFAQNGAQVYYTAGEADRELASYCSTHDCVAVLAKDSDFFVLPVPAYLNLDTLALHRSPPTATVYLRRAVEAALQLPSSLMPLLGSLVGNDFVPTYLLSEFHRTLLPGRHASGGPLIEAVAAHVATAAAAAGWSGPWPCTPLLWCALDWRGCLSPEARARIERSLEQYAVSEGFRELPTALLERASGASSAMLRRFRRGRLDSAVFTSATRQAIWRGPSIDDPDSHPTILASRPIRCETYAACVRPGAHTPYRPTSADEVTWGITCTAACTAEVAAASAPAPKAAQDAGEPPPGDGGEGGGLKAAAALHTRTAAAGGGHGPDHGDDGRDSSGGEGGGGRDSGGGSGACSGACSGGQGGQGGQGGTAVIVSEHIIYSTQAQHGSAEPVPVPPQLASCEAMWALSPGGRGTCMLRSLARACRGDRELLLLDAPAMIALGPLSLVALSVRYMRRHRLVPRPIALVTLCQGLVMAWLAETRQRLPTELRKRSRRCASLQAAHFASLFTRVSADVTVLNSACGAPLALHGPWEWFDGVLFESMFAAAAGASPESQAAHGASSCWAGLLRGDPGLLAVFEQLRPFALADEQGAGAGALASSTSAAAGAGGGGGSGLPLDATRAAAAWKKACTARA